MTLTNDYYIGETEVTIGEYLALMDEMLLSEGGTTASCDDSNCDKPWEGHWHLAAAFANAVSSSEGLRGVLCLYRL